MRVKIAKNKKFISLTNDISTLDIFVYNQFCKKGEQECFISELI